VAFLKRGRAPYFLAGLALIPLFWLVDASFPLAYAFSIRLQRMGTMSEVRFYDEARIYVKGGDGGSGVVAFRREKYVPRGGPNGGNGGKGGDVVLRVNPQLTTLLPFQSTVHYRADRGRNGEGSNRQGANGPDLILDVPPGTIVRDAETGDVLGDLTADGQMLVVAPGGRGGRGNAAFKSSANTAPRVSEKGEPGMERWLRLELKLLADVGLIGLPNAGKSTLLSVISAARPKIADYPFTTLSPNLGMVAVDDLPPYVVADIPGLIEGAHEGKGLGDQFLRHIERTRLLVHLLDGSQPDPLAAYEQINNELAQYSERLVTRPQLVVFNKMDLPEAQAQWPAVAAVLDTRDVPHMAISAAAQTQVRELKLRIFQMLQDLPAVEALEETIRVYRPLEDPEVFQIEQDEDGTWVVIGKEIERIVAMTNFDQEESLERFQRQLRSRGIASALAQAGVTYGDMVRIGEVELEWQEE
jgi:GTP-binding protein